MNNLDFWQSLGLGVLCSVVYAISCVMTILAFLYVLRALHQAGTHWRCGAARGRVTEKKYRPRCCEEWEWLLLGVIPIRLTVVRKESWIFVIENDRGNTREILVESCNYHNFPLNRFWPPRSYK